MKKHYTAMYASSSPEKMLSDVQRALNTIEQDPNDELVSTQYSHTWTSGGFNHSCMIHYTTNIKS